MQRNTSFSNTYIEVLSNLAGTYCGPGSRYRGAGSVLAARNIREALSPDLSNLAAVVQALEMGLPPGTVLPVLPSAQQAPMSSIVKGQSQHKTNTAATPLPHVTTNGSFAKKVGERVTAEVNFLPFLRDLHQTSLRLAKTSSAQDECRRLFDGILKNPFFNNEVALMLSSPDLYPLPKKEGARWADCYEKIMDYANYVDRLGQLSHHEKPIDKVSAAQYNVRFYAPYQEEVSSAQVMDHVVSGVKLK